MEPKVIFLYKRLNGKFTFLSYAIRTAQTAPLSSKNWSHPVVNNSLVTTLTKIYKISKNRMYSHFFFLNSELF